MAVRPLHKELQELARQKLNEDPNKSHDDIKHIREWARTLPHLKIRTDDQLILNYLRGCRFKLDLVKRKLEFLHTMKLRTPEWFTNRDPFLPEMQDLLNLGICLPLPNPDPGAPRVIMFRDCAETLKFKVEDRAKLAFMMLEILIHGDDNYVVAGTQSIGDCKNVSFQHVYQVQPGIAKKVYRLMAHGYAIRPRGFHGINLPWVAKVAYNTFSYAANKKLLSMVHIYQDDNIHELYNIVPISLLPKEYGGEGGSVDELTNKWKKTVESYRDWFLEEDNCCDNQEKETGHDEEDECYEDAQCLEEQCFKHADSYRKEEKKKQVKCCSKSYITTYDEFLGLGGLIG